MGLNEDIRKIALKNAFEHRGKADVGAVMSKILGQFPEYRSRAGEIISIVREITDTVNRMSPDELDETIAADYPEFLNREKKVQVHRLPDLRNVKGRVVMRLAPSPSGPLHMGHSRMAILNDEYVRRYGGDLVLRIEDTNPANIDPFAYEQIPRDLQWLGVDATKFVIQSDRMEIYYDEARKLLADGHAYICTCDSTEFKEKLSRSVACEHRSASPDANLGLFEEILGGRFRPGKAVMIVKTQLDHPNPSVRDWIAFRISEETHPRQGKKYRFYPMMNFSVAVDDHLLGLTHVIRGKDHINNTEKQKYLFNYNGWELPEYYHYGLVTFPNVILKTSIIKKGIADGTYSGWDDVRLGTLLAFRRRGFSPATFRRYWVESGMRESDSEFSLEIFYSMNKEQIDYKTRRFFFVPAPTKIAITGGDDMSVTIRNHPSNPELGKREYRLRKEPELYIPSEDWDALAEGGIIRLKDLCNIRKTDTGALFESREPSGKGVKIIQWSPKDGNKFTVSKPDGSSENGIMEPAAQGFTGVAQLERYGYVNIASNSEGYFTHK